MVCIRIETITGKSIIIDAENANEIREKIENEMGIPKNEQTLLLESGTVPAAVILIREFACITPLGDREGKAD